MEEKRSIKSDSNISLGKDFIVKSPGWLTRHGIGLVSVFMLILLLLSAFLKYPDKVSAPAIITSYQPPIRIKAPRQAVLDQLLIQQGQTVKKDQLLAVFEHDGSYTNLLFVDSLLKTWIAQPSTIPATLPKISLNGSLMYPYKKLENALEKYIFEIEKDYTAQKIRNLKQQILSLQSMNKGLERQIQWRDKSLAISKAQVKRDSNLFLEGSVSAIDYENAQKHFYSMNEAREDLEAKLLENQLKVNQLEGEILDINQQKSDLVLDAEQALLVTLSELNLSIQNWKNENLIIASTDGEVQMNSGLALHKFYNPGEELMVIVPKQDKSGIKGTALIPYSESGKVEPGATVHIKLEGYPYKEYGVLKTTVQTLAPIASEEKGYEITFQLADNLKTTYGKVIPFKQEMKGNADIITEKRSLLERLFKEFTHLLKNN
ncbi:MAG: HlyD family efflux transporter periplasmic adaptor subunit [Saprospiraceae bacterium]|nr:HlyD family efflux transporter periplasmic adaptor subunit [Saprospiraceae bacterium]